MPKISESSINLRKKEIIDACEILYQNMNFKDITIKEIGNMTSFTRTSIYNYFQTKEEIFLALLQREYYHWNEELSLKLASQHSFTKTEIAEILASTLTNHLLLLKILSMNMYEIEENCREEKLIEFKKEFKRSMSIIKAYLNCLDDKMSKKETDLFIYTVFPLMYGIYPYTHPTDKQRYAMEQADIEYHQYSVYEMIFNGVMKLLKA